MGQYGDILFPYQTVLYEIFKLSFPYFDFDIIVSILLSMLLFFFMAQRLRNQYEMAKWVVSYIADSTKAEE